MSANINTYIGRQDAWHKLGTVNGSYFSWEDALAAGGNEPGHGLNFDVVKEQLSFNGKLVDAFGTFRTDNWEMLGPVGADYTIHDHKRGFSLMNSLVTTANHGAHFETVGVLGKGEKVWGLIDLGMTIQVGEDVTKSYLMFATAYDGSMSTLYKTVNTRIVCQNTLSAALSEKTKGLFRIRHTKNSSAKIEDAHAALANIQQDVMNVEQKLNFLAGRKVTRESVESIFNRLFPVREAKNGEVVNPTRRNNTLSEILAAYEANDNDAFPEQRGSAYNLLNAITNHTDHSRGADPEQRAISATFGTGDKLKTQAYEVILESANSMPVMPARRMLMVPSATPITPVNGSYLDAILQTAGV